MPDAHVDCKQLYAESRILSLGQIQFLGKETQQLAYSLPWQLLLLRATHVCG
jgi:hypothetical protein